MNWGRQMTRNSSMNDRSTVRNGGPPQIVRSVVRPLAIAVPLWIVGVVYLGAILVSASAQAKASAAPGSFPRALLGIPMLDGFREGSHFGVHLHWGIMLVILVPAVLSVVPMAVALVRGSGKTR